MFNLEERILSNLLYESGQSINTSLRFSLNSSVEKVNINIEYIMLQWSLILVSYVKENLTENFLLVKSKYMPELLPLKKLFVLIKSGRQLLSKKPVRAESVGSSWNHPITSGDNKFLQNNKKSLSENLGNIHYFARVDKKLISQTIFLFSNWSQKE